MHHAVGTIGPVECGTRTQNDLDAFDVVTGDRNELVGIDPQGGHPGNAVVGEAEQGTGKNIVEAPH